MGTRMPCSESPELEMTRMLTDCRMDMCIVVKFTRGLLHGVRAGWLSPGTQMDHTNTVESNRPRTKEYVRCYFLFVMF